MIDIISAALGVFCGGCIGFIAGKLASVSVIDTAEFEKDNLRSELEGVRKDLLLAQKERINLAAKVAMGKPKRGKGGRFVSKSKGEKG
jgi:hypothetical protein